MRIELYGIARVRAGREWVEVEADPGLTWASFEIRRSMLGSIVEAFYKLPVVEMEVELDDGRAASYRIVPDMARAGFLRLSGRTDIYSTGANYTIKLSSYLVR